MYIDILKNICIITCVLSLFFAVIGIAISQNVLQAAHFVTIIEVISIPLAIIVAIFLHKAQATKMLIYLFTIPIISPISSYFIGKLYLLQNNKKR